MWASLGDRRMICRSKVVRMVGGFGPVTSPSFTPHTNYLSRLSPQVLAGTVASEELVMESEASTPPQRILTMDEVLQQAGRGRERLIKAGRSTKRDNQARLAWKRSRGIDTTVEERRLRLRNDAG